MWSIHRALGHAGCQRWNDFDESFLMNFPSPWPATPSDRARLGFTRSQPWKFQEWYPPHQRVLFNHFPKWNITRNCITLIGLGSYQENRNGILQQSLTGQRAQRRNSSKPHLNWTIKEYELILSWKRWSRVWRKGVPQGGGAIREMCGFAGWSGIWWCLGMFFGSISREFTRHRINWPAGVSPRKFNGSSPTCKKTFRNEEIIISC